MATTARVRAYRAASPSPTMWSMDAKAALPYPYNLDLSPVLHGLARRTVIGRRRLANDPVTAAYLAAGLRLLERQISSQPAGAPTAERPLLRLLSQRAVSDEVANNPDPFVRVGSTSTLRATGSRSRITSPTCSGSACGRSGTRACTRRNWRTTSRTW